MRTLKYWRLFLSLTLFAIILSTTFIPARAMHPAQNPTNPAELEAFLDGIMAAELESNHVPGAVVTVVKDGRTFLSKGYGYADLEKRLPVDSARTLFRPGSVSKLFVWTAVMQQVEQGKLSLDADINEYLDFTIPTTYEQPITMRHLMAHTAGFEDNNEGIFVLSAGEMRPFDEHIRDSVPARVFPPGQVAAYSNYGAALAGYIVARVSGMPFDDYVEQNIFAPLGMEHTTFAQPLPGHLAAGLSKGYNFTGGQYYEGGFEFVQAYPAGSLSGTADDMARFMIAHLQDGRYEDTRILEAATAREMHSRPDVRDPRLGGMAHGFFETTINGRRVLLHGGDLFLFHSGFYLLPEENVGLFVSTNGVGGGDVSDKIMRAFMDRYYPVEAAGTPLPQPEFAANIGPYLGSYYMARGNQTGLEKILTLATPISLSLNEEGYAVFSLGGEVKQYVEVEPGLLQARYEPLDRMVYRTNEDGERLLISAAPLDFVKMPWHGSSGLHFLLLGLGVVLFLGTSIAWLFGYIGNRHRRESQPWLGRIARWAAALFGLVFVIFLLSLVSFFLDIIPAYGVPAIFFGDPPGFDTLMLLPVAMLVLAVAMVALSALLWWKRVWVVAGRAYYSLLSVLALALVWVLNYWNLLL